MFVRVLFVAILFFTVGLPLFADDQYSKAYGFGVGFTKHYGKNSDKVFESIPLFLSVQEYIWSKFSGETSLNYTVLSKTSSTSSNYYDSSIGANVQTTSKTIFSSFGGDILIRYWAVKFENYSGVYIGTGVSMLYYNIKTDYHTTYTYNGYPLTVNDTKESSSFGIDPLVKLGFSVKQNSICFDFGLKYAFLNKSFLEKHPIGFAFSIALLD